MQAIDQMLDASGTDLGSLGARFGLSPEQAHSAMGALMPVVAGGLQKQAQTDDLDRVTGLASGMGQPNTAAGNDILGHIFGDKDVSRQVADHAAGQSGISSTVLKAMLPIVAAMAAKHLATGQGGGLGGILGSLAGGGQAGTSSGGLGDLASMLGGGGGANPLDAILGRMR